MLLAIKLQILRTRVERLREHVERCGDSPRVQQEIAKAEAELQAIESADRSAVATGQAR
jgi:hypothetical protein